MREANGDTGTAGREKLNQHLQVPNGIQKCRLVTKLRKDRRMAVALNATSNTGFAQSGLATGQKVIMPPLADISLRIPPTTAKRFISHAEIVVEPV